KVSFDIPDDLPYWKSKPTSFLAHLIGEEGEGSLLSFLKKKGWALDLGTSTWWRMFNIRVTLTEKGKENYTEILKAIFSYINLVKKEGLKKYIFEERKRISEIELENIEPKSSMGRASNYSASMLYYPVSDFLNQYYLYHEYSTEDFNYFLKQLDVNNMQVSLLTKDAEAKTHEDYYNIGYATEKLDTKLIDELKQMKIYKDFIYPMENPYIPSDLSLVMDPQLGKPQKET